MAGPSALYKDGYTWIHSEIPNGRSATCCKPVPR